MKRILAFLLVAMISFSAFAAVSWSWTSPYRNTYGFRYQVNGESEDGWTYVDSSVTELTDENADYGDTLYVQLSLDGKTWSESGVAEYAYPEEPAAPGNVDISTPSIVGVSGERQNRKFEFSIDLDLGSDISYRETLSVVPYTGLVFDFKNIYSPSPWFGLGLRLKGGAEYAPKDGNVLNLLEPGNLYPAGYTDLSLALSFIVADSVDLTLAFGGGLTVQNISVPALFSIDAFNFGTYALAGLSLDRYFGPAFHIGISYYAKYFFADSFENGQFVHNAGLRMGITF